MDFIGIIYGVSLSADQELAGRCRRSPTQLGAIISISFFVYRQIHLKEPLLNLAVALPSHVHRRRADRYHQYDARTEYRLHSSALPATGFRLLKFTAALAMLPGGFLNGIMSPITGRILDRHG